jgi:pimeloyl-ACP methyl ester carboxylesterase
MGLGGMKYAWQRQTKDFGHTKADVYSSLVFDNRGIGSSSKPTFRWSTTSGGLTTAVSTSSASAWVE